MAQTIDITDRATPLLKELGEAINSGALNNAMGRGATNRIKDYLVQLNGARPNKLGGKRTNFFTAASKATNYQATPEQILISISTVGFRQRVEGGRIRPFRKKFLTIPARAEAYGKRASEFPDLVMMFNKAHKPIALVQADQSLVKFGNKRKDGSRKVTPQGRLGGLVMFWLVKEVNQKPDPTVLPTEQEIVDAAIAGGRAFIETLKTRGGVK